MTEDIHQMTRRLFDRLGYKPDKIAEELMAELRLSRRARDLLHPWVRDRVQHAISRMTRTQGFTAERAEERARQLAAGTASPRTQRRSQGGHDSQSQADPRLRFLESQLQGAKGVWKRFADFTAADHDARIAMHQANLNGASTRIATHKWAKRELAKYHQATLAGIPAADLLADLPEKAILV